MGGKLSQLRLFIHRQSKPRISGRASLSFFLFFLYTLYLPHPDVNCSSARHVSGGTPLTFIFIPSRIRQRGLTINIFNSVHRWLPINKNNNTKNLGRILLVFNSSPKKKKREPRYYVENRADYRF